MVLCALLTVFPNTVGAQDNVCRSKVCRVIAEVYENTVNQSLNPCDDFYTYVCAGWMDTVREKLGSDTRPQNPSTLGALEEGVFSAVLTGELRRLRGNLRGENSSAVGVRDSEMQPLMFFKSCRRAFKKNDWDLNSMTLRKFFHEVDLPFFDEEPYVDDECTQKTPLAVLLKLALQFGISPLFTLHLSETEIFISKTDSLSREAFPVYGSSDKIAERWKDALSEESRDTTHDPQLLTELGAILDAFRIRARKDDVLRWGRNYQAVKNCYANVFNQYSNDLESYRLGNMSAYANSSYYDLLDQHTGNILQLDENHVITFTVHFFEPMMILTGDKGFSQIFTDYIRIHLLRNEFVAPIGRTGCALQGESCTNVFKETPLKYCVRLVSSDLLQTCLILNDSG